MLADLDAGEPAGPRSAGRFTALTRLHSERNEVLVEVDGSSSTGDEPGRDLQPLEHVAAALRGDRARGLLIVVRRGAQEVRDLIELSGLIPWLWDDAAG